MSSHPRFLLFIISLVMAGVFIELGIWQLRRLSTRKAANLLAAQSRDADPVDLNINPGIRSDLSNRRVQVRGVYDRSHEIILRQHLYQEVPGLEVITPLRIEGRDSAILVNRGFTPSPDAVTATVENLEEPGTVLVRGIAFPVPTSPDSGGPIVHGGQLSWRRLDLGGLRTRIPYPLMDVYLLQLPDSTLPARPIRLEPPALDNGPHLSYAIQWFSFAVIAVVGGWLFTFRQATGTMHRDPTEW